MPNRQITQILDRRLGRGAYEGRGRLQQIEQRIKAINLVKDRIQELDVLVNTISRQIEVQQGEYYNMLANDPDALAKFNDLCRLYTMENGRKQFKALVKIETLLRKLELLKLRFSRSTIRIAFIGEERQGKSTFIKTITGITSDRVIPAYDGDSCTGTVSVIHNVVDRIIDETGEERNVKVVVDYYDVSEFLKIVNEKLSCFFPDGSKRIRHINDIQTLILPELLNLSADFTTQYNKFKRTFIDNYDEYVNLIGSGTQVYYDEDKIAKHVAQYEEFDEQIEGAKPVLKSDGRTVYTLNYYKYLAVKSVNIYKHFDINELGLLDLVDSIGIGSAGDTKAIEEEMYRLLREDCDAAINLFRPGAIPNYGGTQTKILADIERELADREPDKWIVYVLNKILDGPLRNDTSVEQVMARIQDTLKTMTQKPVAWAKIVNGNNFNEVRDELVIPLLQLIADNLETLDDNLVKQADDITKDAYNESLSLVKAANDVISAGGGLNADAITLFEEKLYKEMLDSFIYEMNIIDSEGYARRKEQKCPELYEAYDNLIKNVPKKVPKKEEIKDRFACGANLSPEGLFGDYIEQMRNDIFSDFENVNINVLYPLQEKVKTDLIAILYNAGMMKCLPTTFDSPSIEWFQSVIDNYVDEATFPCLHKAFQYILDYQINIEGMVEYHVTKSLYIIDRTRDDSIRYTGGRGDNFDAKAELMWNELYNCVPLVQTSLREWVNDFTLIPSHSFYSRVHKFYNKILTDNNGEVELKRFYRKNMGYFWADKIQAAGQAQKAFGDWTQRTENLRKVVTGETFKL